MKRFKRKNLLKISSKKNKLKFVLSNINLLTNRKLYVKDNYRKNLFFVRQLKQKLGVKNFNTKLLNVFFLKTYFRRLDIFLYNLGCFSSLYAVRQIILHKKIYINEQAITKQNYVLQTGDILYFKDFFISNSFSSFLKMNYTSKNYEINYKIGSVVILSSDLSSSDLLQKLFLYDWLSKKN